MSEEARAALWNELTRALDTHLIAQEKLVDFERRMEAKHGQTSSIELDEGDLSEHAQLDKEYWDAANVVVRRAIEYVRASGVYVFEEIWEKVEADPRYGAGYLGGLIDAIW